MRTVEPENTELVSLIARGDEAAFTKFYHQFSHSLYSMVYKILHDEKQAEDVVQEGFVQIWRKAGSYEAGRSKVFTWAVMIMRSKAIDHLRSHQRRGRVAEAVAVEFSHGPGCHEDEGVFLNEKRAMVRAALKTIPRGQRQAIDLAFFSGMTQMQIAAKLGEPLGTVKTKIRRGMLKLRESLDGLYC